METLRYRDPWTSVLWKWASLGERGVRALGRRMLRGEGLLRREDVARGRRRPGGGEPVAGPEAKGPAVILLPAIPWTYRFQRPQQLARALALEGHPVLYVEGFSRTILQPSQSFEEVARGVGRLQLRVPARPDPFRDTLDPAAVERLAAAIRKGLPSGALAVLVQLPFWRPLGGLLSRQLEVPLVYDRIDLHEGFTGVPPAVIEEELALVREADLVTATSPELLQGLGPGSQRAELLPNAAELAAFEPAPRPAGEVRIGYLGALEHWLDAEVVRSVATVRPDWKMLLAGRLNDPVLAELRECGNVRFLGEIPYDRVPGFLASLHVLLIPFQDLPLTRAVDPVKLYEALAAGLPVVARRLPSIEGWPSQHVRTYDRADEVVVRLEEALASRSEEADRERRALVASHDWSARARRLLDLVAEVSPPRPHTVGMTTREVSE